LREYGVSVAATRKRDDQAEEIRGRYQFCASIIGRPWLASQACASKIVGLLLPPQAVFLITWAGDPMLL
jgi:hypothetical protein